MLINAAVSELDLTVQNYVIVQCDDQSHMHMDTNEIEDENNDSESGTEDE